MDCSKARTMLDPYVDRELDLAASLDVETHLRSCSVCAITHQNIRTLRAGMREKALYFDAPASLFARMQTAFETEAVQPAAPSPRSFKLAPYRWWAVAAVFLLAAFTGVSVMRLQRAAHGGTMLAQEAVTDHIRSLMGTHLADVASSNQHTVKPWFDGKLDYSPPVKDLAAQGFPLIGGRLDYLGGRPVAALVYRRKKHLINLFVWPDRGGPDSEPAIFTQQGYHVLHWKESEMTYWAVSDLDSSELTRFEQLIQQK